MKSYLPLFIFATFFTLECHAQDTTSYNTKAKELNNKAVDLIISNPDSALVLLDSAIKIDEHFYAAYANKVNIYCSKGEYLKAIEVSKQGLNLKADFAESVTFLGMLYDKTNQPEKAIEQYLKAVQLYDSRLRKSGKYEKANKINRAVALLLLGNDEGQKEIDNLFATNPEDLTLQMLQNFNKRKYINKNLHE